MAPDTEILMMDGSFRKVHNVHTGDIVNALDASPGKQLGLTTDKVSTQVLNELQELFQIKIRIIGEESSSDTLYLTSVHYFCPPKKGDRWKKISDSKIGDRIYALGGKEAEIVSVEKVDYSSKEAEVPWTKDYGIDRRYTYNIALTKEVAWFVRREGKTPIAVSNRTDLFNYYERLAEQAAPSDGDKPSK
jgi:hypothetical protein